MTYLTHPQRGSAAEKSAFENRHIIARGKYSAVPIIRQNNYWFSQGNTKMKINHIFYVDYAKARSIVDKIISLF